jgi:hypothetical protein
MARLGRPPAGPDHGDAGRFARKVLRTGRNGEARNLARAYLAREAQREADASRLRVVLMRVDDAIAELDREEAAGG